MAVFLNSIIILTLFQIIYFKVGNGVNTPLFVCSENDCWNKPCSIITSCPNGRIISRGDLCGCCDLCRTYQEKEAPCTEEVILGNPIKSECEPGLVCSNKQCDYDKTLCFQKQREHDEALKRGEQRVGYLRPECDVFGNYSPKQCLNTWCFCVNSNGSRIFGQSLVEQSIDMDCECSHIFDQFNEQSLKGELNLRCQPNGNFESLQCFNDKCFCIDNKGAITAWTDVELKWNLTCYANSSNEGNLTTCLQQRYEVDQLVKYEKGHGNIVLSSKPMCDPDGSFSRKQCNITHCFCVMKDGDIIENFIKKRIDSDEMRCDCARDDAENLNSFDQILKCDDYGNYNKKQCLGSMCFCGDENGHRKSNESVHIWELELLKCI